MSLKRRFMLYYIIMLIFPLAISYAVYNFSTNFFENEVFVKNDNYVNYINNSSEVIAFVRKNDQLYLSDLEKLARDKGYHFSVVKDGELIFENLNSDEMKIVDQIKMANYDIVYNISGKVAIATRINYYDGVYDMFFVSRSNVQPMFTLNLFQIFLFLVIIVMLVAVASSNYLVTRTMINSFLKPVSKLSKTANKIRKGELSEPVGKADVEEFEELFITFDLMRKELKANIDKNITYENNRREMLAGMSHDLKTPLTVIQGYSKALIDGVVKDKEQIDKYIQIINRKSIEMESLINQLSIFSKLENKAFVFNYEKFNLDTFLREFITLSKTEYLNKKIVFIYANIHRDINVNIDVMQMNRVFENLFTNSVKYNDNNKVKIKINVKSINEKEVQISFSDNGIGVPEENINNIFENFYRVDESRSAEIEGNGLGLAICKSIVEAHNGKIEASSDKHLEIRITLPIGE